MKILIQWFFNESDTRSTELELLLKYKIMGISKF